MKNKLHSMTLEFDGKYTVNVSRDSRLNKIYKLTGASLMRMERVIRTYDHKIGCAKTHMYVIVFVDYPCK